MNKTKTESFDKKYGIEFIKNYGDNKELREILEGIIYQIENIGFESNNILHLYDLVDVFYEIEEDEEMN